jgi:hypothetical protein
VQYFDFLGLGQGYENHDTNDLANASIVAASLHSNQSRIRLDAELLIKADDVAFKIGWILMTL